MTAAIAIGSDHISMNLLSNRLQSARIVYRWVSMVGLTVGLTVGHSISLGRAGLLTSAKRSTAQMRGSYDYQPRGFNGFVVKQTYCLQTIITVT